MKNSISLILTLTILMLFTVCNNTKDSTSTNKAKIYYNYLTSLGEIEIEASPIHGGGIMKYNVNELYYYLDDFNYDGINDLAISAEASASNGIEIYTYKGGQVATLLSKHMPYSAGTEIFTLAKYNDTYGIKYYRDNSFCFLSN